MNKLAKYIATATLATAFTISAPLNTYACESHAKDDHHQTTQHHKDLNLGSQNIMAVSWYQNSAEAKALYLQGYNSAKYQLDEYLKKNNGNKKLAIALDIDETVLDNSPYQGYAALHDTSFPKGWHEWVAAAKAKPVYGAKSFLKYADKRGIDIYYISDRDKDKDFKGTKKNLKNIGLPQVKDDHILLKGKNDKSKESRRQKVEKNHKLIMLFGDNLLDFTDPKKATFKEREKLVQQHKNDFGKKYFIFPNPMYGSWESTIYNNNYQISKEQKDQLRKQSIKQFDPDTGEVK